MLTMLFTDIEGSSARWDADSGSMHAAHTLHNELVTSAIAANRGSIIKDRGDGYMAVFEDPADAVRAAADAQRALSHADWPSQDPLLVRMGIHTGAAEARDNDLYGHDVNVAARLETIGHGGQVLLSEATRVVTSRLFGNDMDVRDLGLQKLRGIAQPERVFQLLAPGLEDDFPVLAGTGRGIPLPLYSEALLGREAELKLLAERFREGARLVTLLGPGGIGKTRLAVETAKNVASASVSVHFADMAPVTAAAEIGPVFAESVGVKVEGRGDVFALIADRLTESTFVLVDNLEHLTDIGAQLSRLLAESPALRLLATSRTPLGIRDEFILRVGPLELEDNGSPGAAVALFYDRALAQGVQLSDEDLDDVVSLCRRLDGLPLAIELVAARTRMLSVGEIDALLAASLDALGTAAADRPERQRTIRNTIEWSLGSLSEKQRAIYARLSLFPAGPTMAQLEYVSRTEPGTLLADLALLADNSLVNPVTDLPGGTRFRQLSLLREYGAELLLASGETNELMSRVVDFYAESSVPLGRRLLSESAAFGEMAADHPNMVAALDWSLEHGRASDMVDAMAEVWLYWFNGDRTLTVAEFLNVAVDQVQSPKLDWLVGFIHGFQMGDFAECARRMADAAAEFETTKDRYWEAMSMLWQGLALVDYEAGRPLLEAAHQEFLQQEAGPALTYLSSLFLSINEVQRGDLDSALKRRLEAVEGSGPIGHLEAWMHWNLAILLINLDRDGDALAHLPEAFAFMVSEEYQEGIASFAHLAGILAIRAGQAAVGLRLLSAGDAILQRIQVASWWEVDAVSEEPRARAAEELGDEETRRGIAAGEALTVKEVASLTMTTIDDLLRDA